MSLAFRNYLVYIALRSSYTVSSFQIHSGCLIYDGISGVFILSMPLFSVPEVVATGATFDGIRRCSRTARHATASF
jgi:hypothetical protein